MWTVSIRLGLAEVFTVASLAVVGGLLSLAFLEDWTIALVPALIYVLSITAAYAGYKRYASERARAAEPVAIATRFRVVDTRGECPLGHGMGDVVTVGAAGSVAPRVCEPAAAVLRIAARDGEREEVKEWCCPIFDHMLVFERELKAA